MPNKDTAYPYIRAWGKIMQSVPSYIDRQVELAKHEKAPEQAIYRVSQGLWQTVPDMLSEETRLQVIELAKLYS